MVTEQSTDTEEVAEKVREAANNVQTRPTKRQVLATRKAKRQLKGESAATVQAVAEEIAELAEGRTEQEANLKAGTIIGDRKIPYTRKDLDEIYGTTEFIPDETIPITLQGIRFQMVAGRETCVPKEVKAIWDRRKRMLANPSTTLGDRGYATVVEHGAGALPPEV